MPALVLMLFLAVFSIGGAAYLSYSLSAPVTTREIAGIPPTEAAENEKKTLLGMAKFLEKSPIADSLLQRKREDLLRQKEPSRFTGLLSKGEVNLSEDAVRSWFSNDGTEQGRSLADLLILKAIPWTGDPEWIRLQQDALQSISSEPDKTVDAAVQAFDRIPDEDTESRQELLRMAVQSAQASRREHLVHALITRELQRITEEGGSYRATLESFLASTQQKSADGKIPETE